MRATRRPKPLFHHFIIHKTDIDPSMTREVYVVSVSHSLT